LAPAYESDAASESDGTSDHDAADGDERATANEGGAETWNVPGSFDAVGAGGAYLYARTPDGRFAPRNAGAALGGDLVRVLREDARDVVGAATEDDAAVRMLRVDDLRGIMDLGGSSDFKTERTLQNQRNRCAATATLASARATYPATRRALLLRLAACDVPFDIPWELDTALLVCLATAQDHQNNGLAIGRRSAQADAANGGPMGARLAAMLSSSSSFDAEGAILVANPQFPVEQHLLELMCGVIPLIDLMTEMILFHHTPSNAPSGGDLLRTAKAAKMVGPRGALDIENGCSESSSRHTMSP